MKAAKSAVDTTRAITVCTATTVAERGFTSRAARSPINWPGPRTATTRSASAPAVDEVGTEELALLDGAA